MVSFLFPKNCPKSKKKEFVEKFSSKKMIFCIPQKDFKMVAQSKMADVLLYVFKKNPRKKIFSILQQDLNLK
jgi:hypothetical protein